MTDKAKSERFWRKVRTSVGEAGALKVGKIYSFFKSALPHSVKWGPLTNVNDSFVVQSPWSKRSVFLRVYSDGHLHFYTNRLTTSDRRSADLRRHIDTNMQAMFSAPIGNNSHYIIWFQDWDDRTDDLIANLGSAISASMDVPC